MSTYEITLDTGVKYQVDVADEQPKKMGILPTAAQIAGNVGGFGLGGVVGHPYVGAAVGGTLARGVGDLAQINQERVAAAPGLTKIPEMILSNPVSPFATQVMNPEQRQRISQDLKTTALQEGLGAPIGYGIGRGLQLGAGLVKATVPKLGKALMDEVRSTFYEYKQGLSKTWENEVEKLSQKYPDKFVPIKDVVDKIRYSWNNLTQETRAALNKNPTLRNLIASEEPANPVTIKEANQIIGDLNKGLSKVNPKNASRFLDLKDLTTDLKASRMVAFPEMEKVSADYASKVNPWSKLYPYMQEGKTAGGITGKMLSDPDLATFVKQVFPKTTLAKMGNYRAGSFIKKGAMRLAPWVLGEEAIRRGFLRHIESNVEGGD